MNRIVITHYENKIIVLFIQNDTAVKIRAVSDFKQYINTVYLGRVRTVKDNISSCFISYDGKNTGFLNRKDLKPETLIPVSVRKKTPGNKEDMLTDNITVSGIYCVVGTNITGVKLSKKLSGFDSGGYDFDNLIIRSNAANADISSVYNEYIYITDVLKRITDISGCRTDYSILHKGIPWLVDTVYSEDISDYSQILTDDPLIYDELKSFYDEYSKVGISLPLDLKLYEDPLPLSALISLKSKLSEALNRKVYLKSDAFLVIDRTEAMTVIDVNSGTTRFKGDKEAVIHRINLEAIEETARQLKLRNLSGIIIVDLINEKNEDNKKELTDYANRLLSSDDCHAGCHDITKLWIMEITRERKDETLAEQLN